MFRLLLCYIVRGVNEGSIFSSALSHGFYKIDFPPDIASAAEAIGLSKEAMVRLALFTSTASPGTLQSQLHNASSVGGKPWSVEPKSS